jgi:hypothetical protein
MPAKLTTVQLSITDVCSYLLMYFFNLAKFDRDNEGGRMRVFCLKEST